MTIRYKCIGCESVLKIKDEKAGGKGKCPKCKLEFVVPFPEDVEEEDDFENEQISRDMVSSREMIYNLKKYEPKILSIL